MPFSPDQLSELAQLKAADPERPTVVELFRFAAQIALVYLCRLFEIIAPIQTACPALARRWMRIYTLQLRLQLTMRFAPERFTPTQLRRLSRVRHILEFFLNRPIPHLSPSPSPSQSNLSPTVHQPLSASSQPAPSLGPRTSSSATPPASAKPQSSSPEATSPALDSESLPLDNSGNLQSSNCNLHLANPRSATRVRTPGESSRQQSEIPRSPRLARYIPDHATLAAALKSPTLPPSCAAALLENPGDDYARMLVQLDKLFRTIFRPSTPTTEGSRVSDPISPSPSQSSDNLQSTICNPQSDSPAVHPVHSVHDVHPVHLSHDSHSSHAPHSSAPP